MSLFRVTPVIVVMSVTRAGSGGDAKTSPLSSEIGTHKTVDAKGRQSMHKYDSQAYGIAVVVLSFGRGLTLLRAGSGGDAKTAPDARCALGNVTRCIHPPNTVD